MRIETNIKERADIEQVERIQALLETGTAEMLRNALYIFAWAVEETMAGRRLASVDASGARVREMVNPLLERARRTGVYNLEPEGFHRVWELIENPPPPTDALLSLMQDKADSVESR